MYQKRFERTLSLRSLCLCESFFSQMFIAWYFSRQAAKVARRYCSPTAKTLTFSFQDTPSAIGMPEVEGADVTNAPIFDLAGRRITGEASKGVYIRNGKKFVVR